MRFQRTPFDLPLALFLITAGIGVWAAYQPAAAWLKFWLLLTSVVLYYFITRQPIRNLWTVSAVLCLLAFGSIFHFYLTSIFAGKLTNVQLFKPSGSPPAWIRSEAGLVWSLRNDFTEILDLFLPLSAALYLKSWRNKKYLTSILYGLLSCLILAAILISSSRSAILAVAATAALWLFWWITGIIVRRGSLTHKKLYAAILILLLCLLVGSGSAYLNGRLRQVAIGGDNLSVLEKRLHLDISALQLIQDVPFTGSGLDSFSGMYASYIMVTPNFLVSSSHNLYLEAALEQGVIGGLVLGWIYIGSILLIAFRRTSAEHALLRKAVISSLLIITIHGLGDQILYHTKFIPLLFVLPGMAVSLASPSKQGSSGHIRDRKPVNNNLLPFIAVLTILLIGAVFFYHPILAHWYTNLGAVEMAKTQLKDFPTGRWDGGQQEHLLEPSKVHLKKAVEYEPGISGANYRLGLIAVAEHNFAGAVSHLETALRTDPNHRGIQKVLGYSYLWNGQIDAALPMLRPLPESEYELNNYVYWWRSLNRPDLAANAEQYLALTTPH
jgi:putative inorganic carbon (hco3(-)) transporter